MISSQYKPIPHCLQFPGAVVASLSRHRTYRFFAPTTSPSDILGEDVSAILQSLDEQRPLPVILQGMAHVSGYHHVEVGNFSRQELLSLLNYYQDSKWITKGIMDVSERIEVCWRGS